MLSVVFATLSGLSIHRTIIELLHLIGAQDSYIAGQFARHNLRLAFFGGLIGLLIALPVSGVIAWLGMRAGWPIPTLVFSPLFIGIIIAIPFVGRRCRTDDGQKNCAACLAQNVVTCLTPPYSRPAAS